MCNMDSIKSDLQYYLAQYILPVKYAYTSSAAIYHTKYAKSQNYHSTVEIDNSKYILLKKYVNSIYEYDYCEIGSKNEVKFKNYIFIDFSDELLKKCKSTFNSAMPNSKGKFIQHDIEKIGSTLPVNNDRKKIIFFLGNTLGNVESEDIVLQNIYNSMNSDDFLLIGLTLWNDYMDELTSYNNEAFRESILEFLRVIGIHTKPQNYILEYDKSNHIIICEYKLCENFNYYGINLSKEEKIRCFQSRRYNFEYCENLFKKNRLCILEHIIDTELRHILFLLKKEKQK